MRVGPMRYNASDLKAILIPNMVEFPSDSMTRYARELSAALRKTSPPGWEFEGLECHHNQSWLKLLPGKYGEAMASRVGRFIDYPNLIKKTSGDVFHILDHSHANLAWATPAAKSVLTCHDIIPLLATLGEIDMPVSRTQKYRFPKILDAMKQCKKIIAISESTKRGLVQHGGIPGEKIEVVYYGVNPNFSPEPQKAGEKAEILQKHGLTDKNKLILHVGTPMRYKNVPALLHMLTRLGPDVRLVRVGAEFFPDEQALADELGVTPKIIQAGRITDDKILGAYYRSADVFAFPSLFEGFGWPPLEAMACGTPVVTSNVASLPEVVGDAGTTVSPSDHAGLAEAVAALLENPARHAEYRQRALDRARRFTWDACAQNTLAVYEKVIAK
jgi:glycosyltransferase involved in cell wall biosynthesis